MTTAESEDSDELYSTGDDDDLEDMEIPLPSTSQRPKGKPSDDLVWNERSVLACFQKAIESHVGTNITVGDAQKSQTKAQPTQISLPSWAVDPLLCVSTTRFGKQLHHFS
jgi:hypothetical protein